MLELRDKDLKKMKEIFEIGLATFYVAYIITTISRVINCSYFVFVSLLQTWDRLDGNKV